MLGMGMGMGFRIGIGIRIRFSLGTRFDSIHSLNLGLGLPHTTAGEFLGCQCN